MFFVTNLSGMLIFPVSLYEEKQAQLLSSQKFQLVVSLLLDALLLYLSLCWPNRMIEKTCAKHFGASLFLFWSAFPPSFRAFLLITIPTQPYPHSLLQRHQILKSPPLRSSSAATWDHTAFAQSTAYAKSSAPLECQKLQKVKQTFIFHIY